MQNEAPLSLKKEERKALVVFGILRAQHFGESFLLSIFLLFFYFPSYIQEEFLAPSQPNG